MTVPATLAQFHTLLTDQTVGNRALAANLTKALGNKLTGEDIEDELGPTYMLHWDAGPSRQDNIAGGRSYRETAFALTLSLPFGGGHNAGQDRDQVEAELAELWDRCVERLQDINNHDRVTTGCHDARSFVPGKPVVVGHRMQVTGTFVVWIDRQLGDL